MTATGILAIWNGRTAGREDEYEAWYQTEHLFERLAVPGFQRGRRYETIAAPDRFFTYYETDTPEVLTAPAYRARLDDPTPLTTAIMRAVLIDMSRTVCRRTFSLGRMRGSFAATLQVPALPSEDRLTAWATTPRWQAALARLEFWEAVSVDVPASAEAKLRGGDTAISACVFLETLRAADCREAVADLATLLDVPDASTGTFQLLCELTADEPRQRISK